MQCNRLQGRNDDEVSFQPGDSILVFKDHHNEPGWLAGQVCDKVGWFPEAYAECLENNDVEVASGLTSWLQLDFRTLDISNVYVLREFGSGLDGPQRE